MTSPAAPCEVSVRAGDGCCATLDLAEVARVFATLCEFFPVRLARVDIRIVGDAAMDAAHQRYSGVAGTTDVLSFPAETQGDAAHDGGGVEVDLLVCCDVAAREAMVRSHAIERELLLYAVHGTLHACGFRDDTEVAAQAIHAEEDRILSAGGIGVVYACPAEQPHRGPTAHENPPA